MASRESEVRAVAAELDRLCDALAASVGQLTALLGVSSDAADPPRKEEPHGRRG